MQNNLCVVTQTTIKSKVLIYNVDSEHTAEESIDDFIYQNSELRDTSNDQYNALAKRLPLGQLSS
jgi:hypothetical protein